MERRFGDAAEVRYVDTAKPEVREEYQDLVMRVHDEGLLYPVTFIDREPVYDGAVSHAVILRAVQSKLQEQSA